MTARVLVVDDEPDAEPLFWQQFRRLLDIDMPGMGGLDLLPKVKECRPGLPVFVISAYGDPDTARAARERGADEFLTKPVDFANLRRDIMAVQADATRRNA